MKQPHPARFWPVLFLLILWPHIAPAEDSRVQELERNLEERDKVILELIDRVEALERRLGAHPGAARRGEAADTDAPAASENLMEDSAPRPQGSVVVDEAAAERALERSLAREGVLLLPAGVVEIEPGLTYARREDTTTDFVTSSGTIFPAQTQRNSNTLSADLSLRLGLPLDSQFELGLPYQWREIESVTNVGFSPSTASSRRGAAGGDLRVGLAKTLLREGPGYPDIVGRIVWDTDSGERQDNGVALDGGFHEISASLTGIKRQDPVAFVGGLSYQYTVERDQIQPGAAISANFGSFIALSPATSLRLLLAGGYQTETEFLGRKISGSDQTVVNLVVGGTSLVGPGRLLNVSARIGLTNDADDFALTLSLPVRLGQL